MSQDGAPTYEVGGSRVWFLQTAQSSGGAVHEQRVEYHPGSPFPPTHFHPAQDEDFEIESGSMVFVVAGEERVVDQGDHLHIPRGTPHRARNASSQHPAVVRWATRPALRTTAFFWTVGRLGEDPSLLDTALLAHEFRDVLRPTGVQGALVPVVGRLATVIGRRLPEA